MPLTPAQCSRIQNPGRPLDVVLEIRVMEDGNPYWCDVSKAFPVGITREGGDPGVNRLMDVPAIAQESERGIGHYSTRPVTIKVRNDDGLFFRTAGIWLLDENGTERFLATWKRAWVRLRAIELAQVPDLDDETTLGVWYIDKISGGEVASLTLQPLERLLQTASPRTVMVGNRWIRDADVGEIFQRVARHAIPGVTFESGSPVGKVRIDARPGYEGTENPIRLGTVIDNMGRQPERIAGELTFDTGQIPTYVAEDPNDTSIVYYATCTADRLPRLWRYTISTGESELLWTGTVANGTVSMPICYIATRSTTDILFVCMANAFPAGMETFNRKIVIVQYIKATGDTNSYAQSAWSMADAITFAARHPNGLGAWSVGNKREDASIVEHSGEPLLFGFPQSVNMPTTQWATYGPVEDSLRFPRQVNQPCEWAYPYDKWVRNRRLVGSGGWSCARIPQDIAYGGPVNVWHHLAPFPTGIHYLPAKDAFYWLRFIGNTAGEGSWWLYRFTIGVAIDSFRLAYSGAGQDIKTRMPTCFIPVSNVADPVMGSVHRFIVGTYWHRMTQYGDPVNLGYTALWSIDLDAMPGSGGDYTGMTLIQQWDPTSMSGTTPFPVMLDGAYVAGGAQGSGEHTHPRVIGCWLDRRSRLYSIWELNLTTNAVSLVGGVAGDANRSGVPVSGAPFSGFRALPTHIVGTPAIGRRRCFFRDCGSGMLWEWVHSSLTTRYYRTMGAGTPVDPTSTWEAVPRLALIQDTATPANTRIFGFSAPGPPLWAYQQDSLGVPQPNPAGSYRLWALGASLTVRVPIADFSEACAKNAHEALSHLAQAAGSNYRWGFTRDAELFFAPRSSVPVATLIPADEAPAEWTELEIPIIEDVERDDQTEDDVANQIHVVPWVPEVPAVSAKLDLAPRPSNEGTEISGSVSGRATTDAAVRVVLHVLRDGMVGGNDLADEGYSSDWNTGLLLLPVINVEDIVTELAYPTTTLGTLRVRGMTKPSTGDAFSRLIGGATVIAAYLGHMGDLIVVGDSATGRITGFSDPDTITTTLGVSEETIPAGTTVRIMPLSGRGAKGSQSGGLDGGVVLIGDLTSVLTTTVKIGLGGGDALHIGDVIMLEGEAMLVTYKWPLAVPETAFTHEITVQRGYFGTKAVAHGQDALVQVLIHPRDDSPRPIGASGITAAFLSDSGAWPWSRAMKSGDRFILEFPGSRATASKYHFGLAEGAASIARYGKRELQVKENPYMAAEVAPHYAYQELQVRQWERSRFRVVIPWAPEIGLGDKLTLQSARALPDETDNKVDFWITSVQHDESSRRTRLSLISDRAVASSGAARIAGTARMSSAGTT